MQKVIGIDFAQKIIASVYCSVFLCLPYQKIFVLIV